MNSIRLGGRCLAAAICIPLVLAPCAPAQDSVPLGYAVPKDMHVYIRGVASQTPPPSTVAFEAACAKLVDSKIHEDILDLATLDMAPQDRRQTRAMVEHVLGLLSKVDWNALMAREVVFAEKLGMPMPEYLLVCRAEEAGQHQTDLHAMLEGFARMIGAESAEVRDVERRTGTMTVFSVDRVPVELTAGVVGDVFVLSTSSQLTAGAMRRLQDGGRGSLVTDAEFQSAMKHLPPSTEGEVWIDVEGLFGFVSQVMAFASASDRVDPDTEEAIAIGRALLDELDVIDHVAVSTVSDGTTVTSTSLVKMDPDYGSSRLVGLYEAQEPWTGWHHYVPANATGFVFDSGISPGGLFDMVIDLARENTADAGWTESPMCKRLREIVGHVSGEMAWVSFPQAGDAGCALGETVCLLRLEETEGVSDWMRRHLDAIARYAQSRDQHMSVVSDGELHEARLEAFPWIRPVVGVHEGMAVIATSRAALDELERVAKGEAPNIRSSQRFAELGVGTGDEPTRYIDYAQIQSGMDDLADCMSGFGFFMALMPEERDARAAIKLGVILTKLAAALREFDLDYDTAGDALPADASDTFTMRRVYRYRSAN